MKNRFSKLGFTLIELLIVITIIGILAVVFLPSILSAPEKSRDAARKADVGNIVEVAEALRLDGETFGDAPAADYDPADSDCVNTIFAGKESYFGGGNIPTDPGGDGPGAGICADNYYVRVYASAMTFTYAVVAKVEIFENANMKCADATNVDGTWTAPDVALSATWCYGVQTN